MHVVRDSARRATPEISQQRSKTMKIFILAAMFMTAQFIAPVALAESAEWERGNFGVYAEYSRYIPEDAEDTVCGGNGCAKIETGNGFRFGGLYRFSSLPVALEASLLLAEGGVEFGSGAGNLSDAGDWEYTAKMIGVRFVPNLGENFHFSAGGGVNLWDASLEEFYIADDDGTDTYFTASGGWRFINASWWHSDGDNAIGLGVILWP